MRIPLFVLAAALAAAQSKPIVIKAARMFDGVSDRVVSPGLIVVLGEKIRGVGAKAEIPAGSEVIDLGDATILPGFMDAHTHLTLPYEHELHEAADGRPDQDAGRAGARRQRQRANRR